MIELRLVVHLTNHLIPDIVRPDGPLFHRWLPDGKADAIKVETRDARNDLQLWFERFGYSRDGFVEFDMNRREVDEIAMRRQHHLDGGPLLGEARFAHVTASELEALRQDRHNSGDYIVVGKRVVNFLFPPVHSFVEMLRTMYGQYWLPELQEWDSRHESLGGYCRSTLGLRWREPGNAEWRKFVPTDQSSTFAVPALRGRGNAEYLTEEDWRFLQQSFTADSQLPLALQVLAKANELVAWGHDREALVQAVTAVEISLAYFLDRREIREVGFEQFHREVPLRSRLGVVGLAAGIVTPETLQKAGEAIDIRNEIVHEGHSVRQVTHDVLAPLFDCVKALLQLPELKRPMLYAGNGQSDPEFGGHPGVIPTRR